MTTATVTRVELEGGFFGLVTEEGLQLFPLNLDEAYRKDGLRIRFESEPAAVFTLHQWGTPVTLSNVEEVQ